MCVCVCVYVCVCMYVYVCVCVFVCVYVSRQRSFPRIERFSPIPFSGRPSTLSVPARAIGEHAVERALFVLTI